jgi:hypothetical protein
VFSHPRSLKAATRRTGRLGRPKRPPSTGSRRDRPKGRASVTVYAGAKQEPVEAHWSGRLQGWADRTWKVQHLVTHWKPSTMRDFYAYG